MGYIVSTTFKQLENNKLGQSIGHDFRTRFTRNIRNNLENEIIDLDVFGSNKFLANDNLINQNLKYMFDENGNKFYEDKENEISIYDDEAKKEDPTILEKNKVGQKIYATQMEIIENIKNDIQEDYKKNSVNNRSLPKQTKYFQEGIIYFGADEEQRASRDIFDEEIEGLTDDEVNFIRNQDNNKMNEAAKDFIKEFEKVNGCKVLYLIKHDDEKTPHYHFTFTNYNFDNHKSFNSAMKRADISQRNSRMQDLAGQCFENQGLDFHRGKKRIFATKQKSKNEKVISELNDNTIKLNNILDRLSVQTELLELATLTSNELNDKLEKLNSLRVSKNDDMEDIDRKLQLASDKLEILNETLEKKIVNRKEYSNLSKNLIEDVFKHSYIIKNGKKILSIQEIKKNFDIKIKSLKGVDIQIQEQDSEKTQMKSDIVGLEAENNILRKSNSEKLELQQKNQNLKNKLTVAEIQLLKIKEDDKEIAKINKYDGLKLVNEMKQDKKDLELYKKHTGKSIQDIKDIDSEQKAKENLKSFKHKHR